MGKTVLIAALAAMTFGGASQAQTLDIATVTCTDVAQMPSDALAKMLFWIDGYMGGAAQDSGYDEARLQANIDAAVGMCAETPDATLMDVLDKAENG